MKVCSENNTKFVHLGASLGRLWALKRAVLLVTIHLNLRRLMSYIYIYIYIYMEHPFLMFLDHTQRRSTVGRTPLDE